MKTIKKVSDLISRERWSLLAGVFAVILIVSSAIFGQDIKKVIAQSTGADSDITGTLRGWGWSDNIGWISMNSENDNAGGDVNYSVQTRLDGTLTGWAWSDNIGWIAFDQENLTGCPYMVGGECSARISRDQATMGQLVGWARACAGTENGDCNSASRDDGWGGWISLSGKASNISKSPYAVTVETEGTGGKFAENSYAWGGPVVGWILFSNENADTPNVAIGCGTDYEWNSEFLTCGQSHCETDQGYTNAVDSTGELVCCKDKNPEDGKCDGDEEETKEEPVDCGTDTGLTANYDEYGEFAGCECVSPRELDQTGLCTYLEDTDPEDEPVGTIDCGGPKPKNNVVLGATKSTAEIKWIYKGSVDIDKLEACQWRCLEDTDTTTYKKLGNTCAADTVTQQ